jgi:TolB-like protein
VVYGRSNVSSLFEELRRRNVIRVAVFYVVASWLVLQVAELLFDALDLPGQWLRLVLALLILGMPLVLIFAWVFELTPEGVKREKDVDRSQSITHQTGKRMNMVIVVLLVLAIATVGLDRMLTEPAPVAAPAESAVSADLERAAAPTESIAVLPFADLSPSGDQEYFSDGIAEEILNVLVRVEGLKVASRTTSWGFKGQEVLGIPFMAEKMNVRHVLEGSVRKAGDTVRITAQLIDAETDQHLWSETYDRTLTAESIFEVQDDIAKSIVDQLGIIMDADTIARNHAADTRNINAYELYLEAWQLFTERRSLRRAISLFEQAVETDPGFARAWAGLAAVYNVAPGWGINDREYRPLAIEAAETAIRLGPELSLPYAVLSFEGFGTWPLDFEQSLALLDEALARDPKNTTAYLWRAIRNLDIGYFDQVERDTRQCLEIDPAYEICRSFLALALLFAGDTERALEVHEAALRNGFTGNNLPFLYLFAATGEERSALIAIASHNAAQGTNSATAYEYRAVMDSAFDYEAEKTLIDQAYFTAGAADPEWGPWHNDFLFHYRQYDQINGHDLPYWWFPYPLEFRNSPHRKRIMSEIGLAVYWRKHGFPPQCRPVGDDDFECD